MWLSQFFVHPGMAAAGAALIALPILIHLLNRLQYKTVSFAAMEFLLQSSEQNRKRVLLEQLLLLLLRILIVLLLVALFARLLLDPSQLSLLEKNETHHIVLLDDSGSMRDRTGEATAYQQALKTMKRLISDLSSAEGVHTLTLIRASHPEESPANLTSRTIDPGLVSEFEDLSESLASQCGYGSVAWKQVFAMLQQKLRGAEEKASVIHFLTDFRKDEWTDSPTLQEDLESLVDDKALVNLVPCVAASHDNVAITDLSGSFHTAAVGVPVSISIGVQNFGSTVVENIPLRILVDGEPIGQAITIPKLEAGEQRTETTDLSFSSAGGHSLAVQISADSLNSDNTRYLAVQIEERQRILIADGSEDTAEASYVADALAADPDLTGFEVTIVRPDRLREIDFNGFAAVYLLNVDRLQSEVKRELETFVAAGGGLAWFLGDRVDTSFYNELAADHLAHSEKEPDTTEAEESEATEQLVDSDDAFRESKSLFPIPIGASPRELVTQDIENQVADVRFNDHPLFRLLNAADGLLAYYLNIYRYYPLQDANEALPKSVEVIGELRTGEPLFLESRFGKGKLFIALTSAGPMTDREENRWHNWPFDMNAPGFTVFHLELAKSIADQERVSRPIAVGRPLVVRIDPALNMPEVRFAPPEDSGRTSVSISATPPIEEDDDTADRPIWTAEFRDTEVPGFYLVTTETRDRDQETTRFAANVPVNESTLEVSSAQDLRKASAGISGVIVQDYDRLDGLASGDPGRELRILLLVLLVLFLVCEQGLAYRLGYHASKNNLANTLKKTGVHYEFARTGNDRTGVESLTTGGKS